MSLEIQINEALKTAMRAKDTIALDSLRAVKSQLLLLKTGSKDVEVTEADEIALVQKLIKQRNEAADQFSANDRAELAEKELAQIEVLKQFLPEQISDEDLTQIISEIISETGASSIKDMGKVIGVASQKLLGKADGKTISLKVKELLG